MVQDNDDIIELTDKVIEDASENGDQGIIELTEIAPGNGEEEHSPGFKAPLLEGAEGRAQETGTILPEVSSEDFEAALERVIEKKFSESIEKILFEVMEKVVQKEIADINTSLRQDLDDIGRP